MISAFEVVRMAESIELRMNEAFWGLLPVELAAQRGLECFRAGGAFVTVAPNSISLQRNRVLALGLEEPATEETLDQILDLFRGFRVKRFCMHPSPFPHANKIDRWLLRPGLTLHHRYSKLVRDTSAPQAATTDLQVRRVGRRDAEAFARVFSEIFAWPADRCAWIQAAVGAPGFSHHLAFDGDQPVATGLLYVQGDCGWLGWGGTLTRYRRRGTHAALIAARLKRAAQLGAKWVVCETMEPRRGRPGGSHRGLVKQGFKQAYLRPIWVWERN
jgi:hypothetical protein